jgi:hypothetical protein
VLGKAWGHSPAKLAAADGIDGYQVFSIKRCFNRYNIDLLLKSLLYTENTAHISLNMSDIFKPNHCF